MTQSEKGLSREPLTLKLRTEQPIKQLRALSEFNYYVERAVKIFIRTEIYLASGRVLKCCEKNVQKIRLPSPWSCTKQQCAFCWCFVVQFTCCWLTLLKKCSQIRKKVTRKRAFRLLKLLWYFRSLLVNWYRSSTSTAIERTCLSTSADMIFSFSFSFLWSSLSFESVSAFKCWGVFFNSLRHNH